MTSRCLTASSVTRGSNSRIRRGVKPLETRVRRLRCAGSSMARKDMVFDACGPRGTSDPARRQTGWTASCCCGSPGSTSWWRDRAQKPQFLVVIERRFVAQPLVVRVGIFVEVEVVAVQPHVGSGRTSIGYRFSPRMRPTTYLEPVGDLAVGQRAGAGVHQRAEERHLECATTLRIGIGARAPT